MPKPSTWIDKQLRRIGFLLVLAALIFVGVVAWFWFEGRAQFSETRKERLSAMAVQQTENAARLEDYGARLEDIGDQINLAQQKARRADEIAIERRQRVSTWDRWIGDPAGQKENEEQMKRMVDLRDAELATVAKLNEERIQLAWKRDELAKAQGQLGRDTAAVQSDDQAWTHFIVKAWRTLRPWYFVTGIVYFVVWPLGWLWWRLGGKKQVRDKKT